MSTSDIQTAVERAVRQAALQAIADLDLAGGQLLVSGTGGVARVLDMSRSKIHRLRVAASRNGIPFPEPALYSGLDGTKSYWLQDIEGWVRDITEAAVDR